MENVDNSNSAAQDTPKPGNDQLTEKAREVYNSGRIVGTDVYYVPGIITLFESYELGLR